MAAAYPSRHWADVRRGLAWLGVILFAGATGAVTAVAPALGIAAAAVGLLVALIAVPGLPRRLFLVGTFGLVLGYAAAGRGFAYIGVPPVFLGELLLVASIVAMVMVRPLRRPGVQHLLLVAFMAWGAIRTVPYVASYGIDAPRDAVVWIYATFALALSLIIRPGDIRWLVTTYGKVLPYLLVWIAALAVVWFAAREALPRIPGTDVEFPFLKQGDMGVHLAGAAAFLLLGLGARSGGMFHRNWIWVPWLFSVGVVIAYSRSAMLAIGTAVLTLLYRRSLARWAPPALLAVILVATVGASGVSVDVGRRTISVEQVIGNVQSIFGSGENEELAGTRQWREEWWGRIVDYTIGGPYALTGKGYGVNLAADDGFLGDDPSLRAPHSAHLNILARSGLPGLLLWVAIAVAFLSTMIVAARRAARAHLRGWLAVIGWLTVYWLAAFVNMSFDVYLEGPQGGIVFWTITGVGLAAAACVRELVQAPKDERVAAQVTAGIAGDAMSASRTEADVRGEQLRWRASRAADL